MRQFHFILGVLLTFVCVTANAAPFKITSTASVDQGALPVMYTCDGKNISPEISWSGKPAKTRSFALILSDPDAPAGVFYHWVLYNIPADTTSLAEGVQDLPAPTQTGSNSWGKTGYNGPCPPRDMSHHYIFTLYALDSKVKLADGAEAEKVLNAIRGHTLDKTTFVAVYTRWI